MLFNSVEDTAVCPAAKTPIEGVPLAVFFRHGTPSEAIFGDKNHRLEKSLVVNFDIAPLLRKQVFNLFVVFVCPLHGKL
jgi:hypothetical protein